MSTVTIHIGSNLDVLPTLAENSIDAIVTDPPYELGFMGKAWDASGIAYNVELWKQCLRVLKPGGHLLAFSGSRTYHRMTCAIEDAGYEVRDQIMWVYGSGFPKSLDVGKSLDKKSGYLKNEGKGMLTKGTGRMTLVPSVKSSDYKRPEMKSDAAKQWDGWGTALKPAHEPICVARKPLNGTVADNVMKWGTGAINVDACRVGEAKAGRWPANLIHDGSDEVLELFPETGKSQGGRSGHTAAYGGGYKQEHYGDEKPGFGDSGSAARFFYCPKTSKKDRDDGCEGMEEKSAGVTNQSGRGYKTKCAKCDGYIARSDGVKPCTCDEPEEVYFTSKSKNNHPTVKPTELMRYLCRLVTPPGGTVLDPFMGSGSTGRGAILEGFSFTGIELSDEYAVIARARIDAALKSRQTPT